jgi:hypothetical protein
MGKQLIAAVPSLLWWASSDGICGMYAVGTRLHSSDRLFDISGQLLLASTVTTDFETWQLPNGRERIMATFMWSHKILMVKNGAKTL